MYRDPLAGLRSQIATKRGLLENREQHLPALLFAMLPERIASIIKKLRDKAREEADSLETLTSVDAALDELLAAHDEAANLLPDLRECPNTVPDPPKGELAPPWAIEESYQLGYRAMLTKRVLDIAPDAYLVRWDDPMYLSRIRVAGAPIIVTSRLSLLAGQPAVFKSTARTSVPASTPELDVRRDRVLLDGIGRAIGLVKDLKVGSEEFDDAFVVTAAQKRGSEEAAVVGMLTSDVVAALLDMRRMGPHLEVRRGIAELTWSDGYNSFAEPLMPNQAIAIMLGIRAAIERA
jgi:hypothetical protein